MNKGTKQFMLLVGGVVALILLLYYGIGVQNHVGIGVDKIHERVMDNGGQIGEVTFSLAWENYNDLDLHVITPSGEEISFRNRRSRDGGELDIDKNVRYPDTREAIENIRWLQNTPVGEYKVFVDYYAHHRCGDGCEQETPFEVLVKLGEDMQHFEGSVSHEKEKYQVGEFYWGGA